MLVAEHLYKSYGQVKVLRGISLEISSGEIVALVGSSGAGKSTLLQLLGTLDFPDSGEVWFNGENISRLKESAQARFRNEKLGFVFQFHHLLPEFSALENVCMPAWLGGKSGKAVKDRGAELLDLLNLSHRISHLPSQLSGGEQQRVAIARALINSPALILADEPTGNLDSENAEEVFAEVVNLSRSLGVTFLIATHQEHMAEAADRCMRMKDGMIQEISGKVISGKDL
jgi:lipoprotein-releasing system ATP-binding protein